MYYKLTFKSWKNINKILQFIMSMGMFLKMNLI